MHRIIVNAPAKVNLHLGVSSEVEEGRHLLDSVFQTISLSDILIVSIEHTSGQHGIEFDIRYAEGISVLDIVTEDNIVYKTIYALADALKRPLGGQLHITLEKRIPVQGGLGGGSSDCAATILALATLWEIDPLGEVCLRVAQQMGSDVLFFLYGGCARMGRFGDSFREVYPSFSCPVVLVKPLCGISTTAAYRAFDENPVAAQPPYALIEALTASQVDPSRVALELENNLYSAAVSLLPELASICENIQHESGVYRALLSGSGSTVFGLCESSQVAQAVARKAQRAGYWAHACETQPQGVSLLL